MQGLGIILESGAGLQPSTTGSSAFCSASESLVTKCGRFVPLWVIWQAGGLSQGGENEGGKRTDITSKKPQQ